jgi:hypothetical protein
MSYTHRYPKDARAQNSIVAASLIVGLGIADAATAEALLEGRDVTVDTKAGALRVKYSAGEKSCMFKGYMPPVVYCRFDDVEAARKWFGVGQYDHDSRLNPHSGKWNWHFAPQETGLCYEYLSYSLSRLNPSNLRVQ